MSPFLSLSQCCAPSPERAIRSLKDWGVTVNDAFFLGGIEKADVLKILKPHLFLDDQASHLTAASRVVPSLHVPFGVTNEGMPVPVPVLVEESAWPCRWTPIALTNHLWLTAATTR